MSALFAAPFFLVFALLFLAAGVLSVVYGVRRRKIPFLALGICLLVLLAAAYFLLLWGINRM